jgi:hypothetical protein
LAALESIAGMLSNSVLHGALGCGTAVCVCCASQACCTSTLKRVFL